jgi:hypothetical protein
VARGDADASSLLRLKDAGAGVLRAGQALKKLECQLTQDDRKAYKAERAELDHEWRRARR